MRAVMLYTVRELLARKIILGFFFVSSLFLILLLLALRLEVVDGALAFVSVFGLQVGGEIEVSAEKFMHGLESVVASAAFTVGIFLSIFATASLFSDLVERGAIDLFLSRPISRTWIFIGRFLAGLAVIVANIIYLVGGLWFILSVKVGIYDPGFIVAGLIIVFAVMVLFAFMALIGLLTRSPQMTIMLTYSLFVLSSIFVGHEAIAKLTSSPVLKAIIHGLYYILPKIAELGTLMLRAIMSSEFGEPTTMPAASVIATSAFFGGACFVAALRLFQVRDY